MKKLYVLCLALVAVFAFSAMAASSAFAVVEWLADENEILKAEPAETTGELTLTDLKAPIIGEAKVKCSGSLDGFIGPGAADEITEVLNLAKEPISTTKLVGLGLECTSVSGCEKATDIKVWALNLPWKTTAELVVIGTHEVADNTVSAHGTSIGWEVECLVLDAALTDECTQVLGLPALENMVGEGVLGIFNEQNTANCTEGGASSGDIEGEGLTTLNSGLALTVDAG